MINRVGKLARLFVESVKSWVTCGLVLAVVGTLMWVLGPLVATDPSDPAAGPLDILLLLAVLVWALIGLWRKRRRNRKLLIVGAVTLATLGLTCGADAITPSDYLGDPDAPSANLWVTLVLIIVTLLLSWLARRR